MQKQTLWTRDFLGICFSVFFLFMTFYGLIATLPMFVIEELEGGKKEVGFVTTSFVIAAVIIRPFAGKWLDELGRKKILLVCLAFFVASSVMYLGVMSLFFLLALRFFHGASFGVATTANFSIAADLVPLHRKGEGIGYMSMFMNVAMVLGPFLGLTIVAHYNYNILFITFSILSLLSFLCGSITRIQSQPVVEKKPFQLKSLIEPRAIPVSLSCLVLTFAYSGVLTFIPVYAKDLGLVQSASYFFVVYAVMVVLSRPFVGRLFDRLGEHFVVYPSFILFITGLICLSFAQTTSLFLVSAAIIGLGFGTLFPSFQAIAIKASPADRSGMATGTFLFFFDVGFSLGSITLGIIATYTNLHIVYLISSMIVLFSAVIYYGLYHRMMLRKKAVKEVTL